jgi:NADH-quinone oxidoreductase subunit I
METKFGRIKVLYPKQRLIDKIKGHVEALNAGLKEAIKPGRITIEYPRERRELPDNFRGFLLFDVDACISCFQCAFVCPANAINMRGAPNGRYYPCIDYTKCIFCHFCADTCPRGALHRTKIHDVAFSDMDEMLATTEELLKPPEMIREDKYLVKYEIKDGDIVLVKEETVVELAERPKFEIRPAKVSACAHPENCIACTLCVMTCPSNAISTKVENGRRVLIIDPKLCTGCGLCVKECPTCALALIER